jgi:protein AIR1/2
MSGPFYDPATEPVSIKRGPRERESKIDWPRLPDDWDADAPVDVGKRGKNKDKERLEKRFREQEDDGEDWFNDIRNVKRRGKDQQAPPPGPRGKAFRFGSFKGGGYEPSSLPPSLPTSGSGSSLLARIGDTCGGRNRGKGDRGRERHGPSRQSESSIRIRGAATDQRHQDGRYTSSRITDRERGEDRWDRDKPVHRGSRRGQGPRYRGDYDR